MNKEIEIILVEDNTSDAELTIRALQKNNITNKIIHLKDGQEAIDYFFPEGKPVDPETEKTQKLILLDLKMPKVDGLEVLKKLKSDDKTRNIPIVVFTSSQEDPDIRECYRLGVNSYIVKPVEFDNFAKVVKEVGFYWTLLNHPAL